MSHNVRSRAATLCRHAWTRALTLLTLLGLVLGSAQAAQWQEKPIKLVVPYPAGGLTDIVSRLVGEEVGKILATALVVPATMITLPLTNPDYKIQLNAAFVQALNTPSLKQRLQDMGYQVVGGTPEHFVAEVKKGSKKFDDLLRSGAVKLD